MWIFNAIANAVGKNFIGTPNYLFGLLFNRVKADGGVTEAQQCTIEELTDLQNDNLLSSASLIVTPSSYKEGKLYSVIPSDGSGDMSVVRATTATRVNSAGLVELVPYNLFTYSQDLANTNWNKSSSTVVSNSTTAPDGTLTADTQTVSAQFGGVNQFLSGVTIGSTYNISFWAKRLTGTNAYSVIDNSGGSGIFGTYTPTTEWVRYSFSFVAASASITLFPAQDRNASGFGSIYIWGLQVNEGGLKDYQRTETRLNIPRLDYSNGSCPSLLVEPQRTNLALYSEQFNDANWSKLGATISANATTAPNGTTTADNLIPSNGTQLSWVLQNFASVAGTTYTFSMYVKSTDFSFFQITGSSGFNTEHQNYNISNGTLASNSGVAGTITSAGNGWYRITYSLLCISTEAAARFICTIQNSGTAARLDSCTGNGTNFVSIWGAQLEAGSYPTSYIPTTSASVTRNADVISKTGISSLIGQTEGTLFIDIVFKNPLTSINRFMSITEAGWQADGSIRIEMNTSQLTVDIVNNGSSIGAITYLGTFTPNTRYKIAVAYKQNDCQMYFNGINAGSDTSTGVMPTCFQLYLNALGGGFNAPYEASNINVAALWKTRIDNATLAQLTTI